VLSYPPGGSAKGHTHPINRGVFSDITLEPSPGGAVRYAIMPMVSTKKVFFASTCLFS